MLRTSLLSVGLTLLIATGWTGLAQAQGGPPAIIGGPGPDTLVGTTGSEFIGDTAGGPDTDQLFDAPGKSDGVPDTLDTTDGDGMDTMYGGPEDTFRGDANDRIRIRKPGSKTQFLWKGTVREYEFLKALMTWLRTDVLGSLLASGPTAPSDFWPGELAEAAAALAAIAPSQAEFYFSDYFAIEDVECSELPWSPANFFVWFPLSDDESPSTAFADLKLTLEEFEQAVASALEILDYLSSVPLPDDGG